MERLNSEGIPRHMLIHALRTPKVVRDARRIDSCLLCRRRNVNEAALCEVCYSLLEGEELDLAISWMRGTSP